MTKKHGLILLAGLLIGALSIIGLHFVTLKQHSTHYHANFALYVNGKRDTFNNFTFYEEVSSCGANDTANPKIRTHMHDNKNSVVHVHDDAATWGHFFANLGYTLGNNVLQTDSGVFTNSGDKKLSFIVNGKNVDSLANKVIGDEDVVLISYGSSTDAQLNKQYDTIRKDAKTYDENADPAACSGSKPLSFWEKFQSSIWSKQESASHSH